MISIEDMLSSLWLEKKIINHIVSRKSFRARVRQISATSYEQYLRDCNSTEIDSFTYYDAEDCRIITSFFIIACFYRWVWFKSNMPYVYMLLR